MLTRRALLARRLGVAVALLVLLPTAEVKSEPLLTLRSIGITGTATVKNYTHFENNGAQILVDQAILQPEWSRDLAPWAKINIVGDLRADDDDFTDGVTFQVQEKDRRRSIVGLKEAVLRVGGRQLEARVGKLLFAWGTGDGYNPTDLINPYDYLDVVDNEKIGVYAGALRIATEASSVELVVIPAFAPSRVPLLRSRWVPDPPAGFVAIVDNREVPPPAISDMQYAARAHTTVKGVDVSITYYDGYEHLPVARRSVVATESGVTLPRLTPVFARIKSPGFDFSTVYEKFELHGEGAFRLVESNGREDRFHWLAGSRYTWDELPMGWLEQVVLTVEYAREEVLASRAHSSIIEPGTLPFIGDLFSTRAFRNAVITRLLVKISEATQVHLNATVDIRASPNAYVQPKLTHKITDALHLEAALDLFAGSPETFWGRWRNNNRLFVSMKYFF